MCRSVVSTFWFCLVAYWNDEWTGKLVRRFGLNEWRFLAKAKIDNMSNHIKIASIRSIFWRSMASRFPNIFFPVHLLQFDSVRRFGNVWKQLRKCPPPHVLRVKDQRIPAVKNNDPNWLPEQIKILMFRSMMKYWFWTVKINAWNMKNTFLRTKKL